MGKKVWSYVLFSTYISTKKKKEREKETEKKLRNAFALSCQLQSRGSTLKL